MFNDEDLEKRASGEVPAGSDKVTPIEASATLETDAETGAKFWNVRFPAEVEKKTYCASTTPNKANPKGRPKVRIAISDKITIGLRLESGRVANLIGSVSYGGFDILL